MTTDTTERGLESLIYAAMTGRTGLEPATELRDAPPAAAGGTGWLPGDPADYDRAHALDVRQLLQFLRATQPEALERLRVSDWSDRADMNRQKFLARLSGEIARRGVIDVLRRGIEHGPVHIDLFYGTPSPGNPKAEALFAQNRFSVTRQLRYSEDQTRRALDLCLFINGLPIATFELKNSLTKQTAADAEEQYKRDRDPRERLFEFGRCVVHFAVDDAEVRMCTHLQGKSSWFLPFNKGWNDGAGYPPNPGGLKTDYLWKEILTPAGLTDILENYAQVLDFMNDSRTIQEAFADYYRTTILSEETDPNKLHDLKAALDGRQVYAPEEVEQLVRLYLGGAERDTLDPILDACVARYLAQLDEDGQVDFKGKAKAFCRTYEFLASILPYHQAGWEKLSIFLNFLVPKLPAPKEDDLAKGILEAIDMDSYRAEKRVAVKLALPDADAEIPPVPTEGGGRKPEPELDRLSNILRQFNDLFGNIPWTDADRVRRLVTEEIPTKVAADPRYQNAKRQGDRQNARIEHDQALKRVVVALLNDDTELFKQFTENESFRRWLADSVFALTYEQ